MISEDRTHLDLLGSARQVPISRRCTVVLCLSLRSLLTRTTRIRFDDRLAALAPENNVAEESPLNLNPLALDCARGEAPFGGVRDRGHEAESKPRVELLGKGRAILLCLSLPAPSKEQYRYCITVLYGTGTVPYIVQF